MGYPKIPMTSGEEERERSMKKLGAGLQAEFNGTGNNAALKGGTGLRFEIGLPRPSTDLDFEGDDKIRVRRLVKKVLKEAFPGKRTRVGPNWGRRGTVKIAIENEAGTGWIKMKVDYRQAGSMPGMPDKVPTAKCEVTHGICIYRGGELAHRKLNTITGEKPRMKARDIYDAGWLAAERPDLIDSEDRRKLKDWLNGLPDSSKNALKTLMRREPVIGRADVDEVWKQLENGIRRLDPDRTE